MLSEAVSLTSWAAAAAVSLTPSATSCATDLAWSATGDGTELAAAMAEHGATVADEVLAVEVHDALDALPGEPDRTDGDLGLTFRIRRVAATS